MIRWTLPLFLVLLAPALAAQDNRVEFVWSGALQPTSVRIVAGLYPGTDSVRAALLSGDGFDAPFFSAFRPVNPDSRTVAFTFDELEPDTPYRYAIEVDGALDTLRAGKFRTMPREPASFRIIASGCSRTASDRPVFDVIRRQDPLFFLHLGDFHYEDIEAADVEAYRDAYRDVLTSPVQAALYRDVPIAYMWDDHDYGPNNSDRRAPGRDDARRAYQEMIPHYPLAAGSGNVPIFQSFSVGRLRFILTDLRSSRRPFRRALRNVPTMMGDRQKDWFKEELLSARDAGEIIVWVSSVPWIYRNNPESDSWGGYAEEREDIANFIVEHDIENMVIMAGDSHMTAMDDGTNSDYSTSGDGPPIPVIQAAPLDQAGSTKGGPYSEGEFPTRSLFPPHNGQWVLMEVEDDGGDEVCIAWTGYRTRWDRPSSRPLVKMERCFAMPTVQPAQEETSDGLGAGQ